MADLPIPPKATRVVPANSMSPKEGVYILFVHGAGRDIFYWERIQELAAERGYASVAVSLAHDNWHRKLGFYCRQIAHVVHADQLLLPCLAPQLELAPLLRLQRRLRLPPQLQLLLLLLLLLPRRRDLAARHGLDLRRCRVLDKFGLQLLHATRTTTILATILATITLPLQLRRRRRRR